MVSRCANPQCAVPLRYLRDGRIFQFEVRPVSGASFTAPENGASAKKPSRAVSHFWLCGQCASTMTLTFDELRGVTVIPLQTRPDTAGPQSACATL